MAGRFGDQHQVYWVRTVMGERGPLVRLVDKGLKSQSGLP